MKRLLLFTILTFVLVSTAQATVEKKGCKPKGCSHSKVEEQLKCKDVEGAKTHSQWAQKDHKVGFDKFTIYHKDMIFRLKKIRVLAAKENATETVKAIDELVEVTHKQSHEKAKLLKKKMYNNEGCEKITKSKNCPPGCIKSCCAARKKTGTCPKNKELKACPPKCPKVSEEKKEETCSKTKAEKTCSGK